MSRTAPGQTRAGLLLVSRHIILHTTHRTHQGLMGNVVGETRCGGGVVVKVLVEFDGLLVVFEIGGSVGAKWIAL